MPSLTRDEAATRAQLLRVDSYEIDLDLTAAREAAHFTSTTTVRFSCAEPGGATFVELRPKSILEVRLNGAPLDPAGLVDNRLPIGGLRAGNELVVRATMPYSNSGEGIHKFTDPQDGEVYLYAYAGLDSAQRIYACFDQPDLKAPVRLAVTAPEGWTVWANGAAAPALDGRWEFAETPPLPTYLVTLVAGPYHALRAEHDGIPLGLISRRSLAAHLDRDADEIFAITRASLDRYHELFGIRYPFGKYDQAFVPEFNSGAVENPGCVNFREQFLFRSAVTDTDRELRAVVIAHEMAHMWFGGLVTLRWWDGIWLNESFAEYMGWRVGAGAWTSFTIGRKIWGYAADQRPSTHPVAPDEVANTALALGNFDGISYAKGASVLRQLVAWLGDEAFLAGLRAYFEAHAFGNATLDDLLAQLPTGGRDLAGWAAVWLRQPQVNTLRPEITLDADGRYREVTVVQTAPPDHPTLRPHRIGVGVYDGTGPLALSRRAEVDLDGGHTPVPELAGTEPGRLLLLNDADLTFAKVRFTPADRAGLVRVLPILADPLARAVTWAAAVDATRDAEWPGTEFLALAVAGLPVETEVAVFEEMLRFARTTVATRFLPPEAHQAALAMLSTVCRRVLDVADPGSSRQLAAARGLVACASSPDLPWLTAWLTNPPANPPALGGRAPGGPGSALGGPALGEAGEGVPDGLAVDAELRWAVLYRMVVLGGAGEPEIAAESARDPSAHGAEHAARCRAAIPDAAAKARAWDIIVTDGEASLRFAVATAEGFWHPEQADLTGDYVERYFTEMPAMAARRTPGAAHRLAGAAYPHYAVSERTLAAAEAMLASDDLHPALRRVAVDATDDLRRALASQFLMWT